MNAFRRVGLLLLALLGMCGPAYSQAGSVYDITDWYFSVGDSTPASQVYSTKRASFVATSDATFLAWQSTLSTDPANTNGAFAWKVTGATDNGSGLVRITLTGGSPISGAGQYFVVHSVGGVTGANGTFQITIIASTATTATVDLIGSTFSGAYTSGGVLGGPTQIDTAANLFATINSYNVSAYAGGHTWALGANVATSGTDVTLTNPVAGIQVISPTVPIILNLPKMSAIGSIPIGVPLTVINGSGVNDLTVKDDRGNAVVTVKPLQAMNVVSIGLSIAGGQPRPLFSYTWAGAYGSSGAGLSAVAVQGNIASGVADNTIPNRTLSQMGANGFKGNNTGGAGNVLDLTVAQSQAVLGYAPLLGGHATVDLNVGATDTPITITSPTTNYIIQAIIVRNKGTTASLTAATLGLFSGTGGGGLALAADQVLSSITSNAVNTDANALSLAITVGVRTWLSAATLQARVGTPQGAAASADIYVFIRPLP